MICLNGESTLASLLAHDESNTLTALSMLTYEAYSGVFRWQTSGPSFNFLVLTHLSDSSMLVLTALAA